jgi:hypothetical protein
MTQSNDYDIPNPLRNALNAKQCKIEKLEIELNKTKQILKHCIPFLPARAITHSGEEIELRELAEEASK